MSLINWIQYTEPAVGANSPTLTDVVNRPLQQVITISGLDPNLIFPGFLPLSGGNVVGNVGITGNLNLTGNVVYTGTFGVSGLLSASGGLNVTGTLSLISGSLTGAPATIGLESVNGLNINGKTGSAHDFIIYNNAGNPYLSGVTATENVTFYGSLNFGTQASPVIVGGATSTIINNHAGSTANVTINDNGDVLIHGAITGIQLTVSGGAGGAGVLFKNASDGVVIQGVAGSSYDFAILQTSGASVALGVPTGTNNVALTGELITSVGVTAIKSGNAQFGGLTQSSGIAAGFNIYNPGTTSHGNYYLVISGKDAADSAGATNSFIDVVVFYNSSGWAPSTVSSTSTKGSPPARTYTNSTGILHIALASGTTWYIDVKIIQFGS